MDRRLELHEILCDILNVTEPDGDRHVYFQPPASVRIKYPAIVYSLGVLDTKRANNRIYRVDPGYSVTLIDKNPDSGYVIKLLELPYCTFNDSYVADNLNHFNFTIF